MKILISKVDMYHMPVIYKRGNVNAGGRLCLKAKQELSLCLSDQQLFLSLQIIWCDGSTHML